MIYNNFKVVWVIFVFTCNRAIEHIFLEFEMYISQLFLAVFGWNFQQLNISLVVIKQQIINDVQSFSSSFLKFLFLHAIVL